MTTSLPWTMASVPPDLWQQVRNAPFRFLGLDYDGTLAPFAIDPMQAKPLPGIADLLRRIVADGQTQLTIVSGRPVREVALLLDNLPVPIIGCHGYEYLPVHGETRFRSPTSRQQHGLVMVRAALLQDERIRNLEYKGVSLAVHTRGLVPEQAAQLEREVLARWGETAPAYELEWRVFNGGVELRCRGWNKGDALCELLDSQPEGVFAVYIGDDETDEDAFAVLHGRGLGIKIGNAGRSTAAQMQLPDCQAVADFLRTWLQVTRY